MATNELKYKNTTITALRNASCMLNESISLSTLPVDTLTATVADEDGTLKTLFESQQYGEVVRYFHANAQVGKFYLEEIEQVGPIDWRFNCISDIGLLVSSDHYGGLYNGEKASVVIADVIGGIIPYTLDAALQEIEIYGWLKKASRRDNLRDILFAIGGVIRRDTEGDCVIAPYEADPEPYPILSSSFYKTGGSVTGGTPATQAILTEHAFAARDTDEVETLFDGEIVGEDIVTPKGASVNGIIVVFDEPHYAFSVQGATLLESGVNYAVLGSAAYGSLTGKKYTHTQRTLTRNGEATGTPNIVQSSKCALVNIRNSPSVADRIIAFYGYATKVTTDLVLTTQKPGDFVSFTDPYGISREGYIQSLEVTMSKVMKALATIICNFIPPVDVPMYFHHELIFSNTKWTVPDGVTSVRVVCIGGGPGGYSGGAGKPGGSNSRTRTGADREWNIKYATRDASVGGTGGVAGPGAATGGKVYSTTIDVTPGQKFQITIGQGGAGAPSNSSTDPVAGSPGGATTFGSISSESGSPVDNGYFEEVTGATYAKQGSPGIAGGDGVGVDPDNESSGDDFSPIKVPAGVGSWVPGQYQTNKVFYTSRSGSSSSEAGRLTVGILYGLGGGAAQGANGNSAPSYESSGSTSLSRHGADGATPPSAPAAATTAGNGGNGGHGGGGGGGFGGYSQSRFRSGTSADQPTGSVSPGNPWRPGNGGNGGPGGRGAPGACFLYYYSPEEPTE